MSRIGQLKLAGSGQLLTFVVAVVVIILVYRISARFPDSEYLWPYLSGIAALAFVAAVNPLIFSKNSRGCIVAVLFAIPVGVILDVNWDWFVNSVDRNLFPFEIVLWWIGAIIFVPIGYSIGRMFAKHNARQQG